MSLSWTLPDPVTPPAPARTAADELQGREIRYTGGQIAITPDGDWAEVSGLGATRQSLLGEALTGEGELVFRQSYGMGIAQAVKAALTPSLLSERESRIRERLAANPRIANVRDVTIERVEIDGRIGLRVTIKAVGKNGDDLKLAPFVIGGAGA